MLGQSQKLHIVWFHLCEISRIDKSVETRQISDCLGLGVGGLEGKWRMTAMGLRFFGGLIKKFPNWLWWLLCNSVSILKPLDCILISWWIVNYSSIKILPDFPVAQMVKNPLVIRETWVWLLGREDPLEEGMATHSSILAWRIPTDREAWRTAVHGAKSQTRLSD